MRGTTKSFWMIFREGGNAPTHLHASLKDALREAERLALAHNTRFYVLEAVAFVEQRKTVTTWISEAAQVEADEEVPF